MKELEKNNFKFRKIQVGGNVFLENILIKYIHVSRGILNKSYILITV